MIKTAQETSSQFKKLTTMGHPPIVMQVLPALNSGGVEQGVIDINKAIVEAGGRSIVVSSGGRRVHEIIRHGGIHVQMPVHSKNPIVMARNIFRLRALIKEQYVDVVHACSRAPAWSASRAVQGTDARYVTSCHSAHKVTSNIKRFYNTSIAGGERVIVVSDFLRNYVQQNYDVNSDNLRVIHRGLALEKFHPNSVSPDRLINITKEWRVPDGASIIILPGRLTRIKGHKFLIDALAEIKDRNIFCVFVGGDDKKSNYRQELEEYINEKSLSGQVRMVNHCDDMAAAYMIATVVVSPSIVPEGFGRIPIEVQAMGRPIIATDHGGAQETILRNETGWLVEVGNVGQLVESLGEAMALTNNQRAILGTRTMSHIADNFTVDKMCRQTLDVYAELLIERQGVNGNVPPQQNIHQAL